MRKLLAALLVAVFFIVGCDDSQYRKAVRATAGISSGLKSLQQANEVAFKAGDVDQDSARSIALAVVDASRVNDAIVQELRSVKNLDAQSKAQLIAHISQLSGSLRQLNEQGVLHVKNPSTKATLDAELTAIQASLAILQGVIQ